MSDLLPVDISHRLPKDCQLELDRPLTSPQQFLWGEGCAVGQDFADFNFELPIRARCNLLGHASLDAHWLEPATCHLTANADGNISPNVARTA